MCTGRIFKQSLEAHRRIGVRSAVSTQRALTNGGILRTRCVIKKRSAACGQIVATGGVKIQCLIAKRSITVTRCVSEQCVPPNGGVEGSACIVNQRIQRTHRCKDGASGRVKGVKNTLNTERSRRGQLFIVRTRKRLSSSRCASTIQIVRAPQSTAETQSTLQPAFLRLSGMVSQYFNASDV